MILDPSLHQVLDPCLDTPECKRDILWNDKLSELRQVQPELLIFHLK